MKKIRTIYLNTANCRLAKRLSMFMFCLMVLSGALAQTQLELAGASYSGVPLGLSTSSKTATLLENTSGSTFSSFNPSITITASISNQQYNNISATRISTGKAINFGGRVNSYANTATQMPVYNSLNTVDNPVNNHFTSNPNGATSTGIDVADNYGFYFYNSVDELFTTNAATNGRYYFGDITLTFSSPVSNPVIHINGLGSNVLFGITDRQGFSSELELQTSGVTLTKLSGSSELNVIANKILNNATTLSYNCGAGAACGSIKAAGTNITSLTFKVYVRGDGNGSAWSHTAINAGDEFMMSASLNAPVNIAGNVFNDVNGLTDGIVNGTGTNLSGVLYVNLVDGNNKVVASVAVANDGSYSFSNIGDGNYTLVLSTTQGTQGNAAPAASLPTGWVNSGENIGTAAGHDGTPNGVLPISISGSNITQANFGIVLCSNIVASTITANGATTACLGAGLSLTSTAAISYQWYNDTIPIAGATSQSFVPTVSGTYSMHIITGGGVCNISSNAISVIINYAPAITITPSDTANICIASNDKICPATWGSSNYQWYKNGVAMAAPQGTSSCLYPTTEGYYSLAVQTGAGCWSLPSDSVYVKIDTACKGSVTSGGGGGVESKSLGDVIAVRLYGNAINSRTTTIDYTKATTLINSGTVVNGSSPIELKDLIPTTIGNINQAYISTPTDLTQFTNAVDVFAVDYTKNNVCKAVAFSTKTLGEVYGHTKAVCDRLKDAQLLEMKKINVAGYDMIGSKLLQRNGEIEYSINFSISKSKTRNSAGLQSNWLMDNYVSEDTMFNFQIWSVSYTMSSEIATAIINKVLANNSVVQLSGNSSLPEVFVEKVSRNKNTLSISIHNNSSNVSAYLQVTEKLNEQAIAVTKQVPITLSPNAISTVNLNVQDAYEHNVYLFVNNVKKDLVYMTDGAWNIDYNSGSTSIKKFTVTNNVGANANANEYPMFRKMNIVAATKDYVTAYKLVKGGGLERNFSGYSAIRFNAWATGVSKVKITLVKQGITNWNEQYSYTLNINNNETEYLVPLKQFISKTNNGVINANDITAISFTWDNSNAVTRTIDATINKLVFTNEQQVFAVNDVDLVIYPNPNNGVFSVNYYAASEQQLVLKVVEIGSGKTIHTQYVAAKKGTNSTKVSVNSVQADGLYMVMLEGDGIKYNNKKIVLNKK